MTLYTVKKAFTELGVYHEIGTVIVDASLIQNIAVKLWDGTLTKEEITETQKVTVNTPSNANKTVNQAPSKSSVNTKTK